MEFKAFVDGLMTFVRENQTYAPFIVMLLAFGESLAFVSLILPFWALLVGIGAIFGQASDFTFWAVLVAAAIGAGLGDWVSYWIGKHYHKQIAGMWPLRNYPDLLPKGHRFFDKYGAWAIVLGRFSGPLRASVPIVAGTVQMHQPTFQLANWSSAFLWAAVLMFFGDAIARLLSHSSGLFGLQ